MGTRERGEGTAHDDGDHTHCRAEERHEDGVTVEPLAGPEQRRGTGSEGGQGSPYLSRYTVTLNDQNWFSQSPPSETLRAPITQVTSGHSECHSLHST